MNQVTRAAAKILRVPVATVALVDKDKQVFKGYQGDIPAPWHAMRETPMDHSFSIYAIASKAPFLVEDAREHPLVKDNPTIKDFGVIAYAAVPLITEDGQAIGTLVVMDSKPRQWTEAQIEVLQSFASLTISAILNGTVLPPDAPQTGQAPGRNERPISRPTQARGGPQFTLEAADRLADAASRYITCLEAYEQFIESAHPAHGSFSNEAKYQNAVLDAERDLEEAVHHSGPPPGTAGNQSAGRSIRDALALWEACKTYTKAKGRRAEALARFLQQRQGGLDDVEREAALVLSAGQAVGLALRTYQLHRN